MSIGYKECYASAARVASPTPMAAEKNKTHRGLILVIQTTAVGGIAPSTVFTIQGHDPTTDQYFTLLASAAVTAIGVVVLRVYPGLLAAANLIANDVLPIEWRVLAVHGNGNSHTYRVYAHLLD